jgi:hypothetical protein
MPHYFIGTLIATLTNKTGCRCKEIPDKRFREGCLLNHSREVFEMSEEMKVLIAEDGSDR